VLALSGEAFASHQSAAALWGMLPPSEGPIHVTVPGDAGRRVFQRAVRRALDLRLISDSDLRDPDITRSELERLFLSLCRRHRFPSPEVNARLGPFEVDFLWRDRGQGLRVLRFTHRQLMQERSSVIAALRPFLGQRSLAPNL
jgi:hypothetical protein